MFPNRHTLKILLALSNKTAVINEAMPATQVS